MGLVKLIGIIQKDGDVLTESGEKYSLSCRGTDEEGYPEVLINAKSVGGSGYFHRQSIKQCIGMKVEFTINPDALNPGMYDCIILKNK